jgi:hypothetical protein
MDNTDDSEIENIEALTDTADKAAANSIYYAVLVNTKSVAKGKGKINALSRILCTSYQISGCIC